MKRTINAGIIKISLAVIAAIAADQIIKRIISAFFLNDFYSIIPGLLSFKPVYNMKMSWFGSLGFSIFADRYFAIGFNILVILAASILFKYIYINKNVRGKLTTAIFILLFAGALCSAIDKIFWGGSLDYLRLEGFFTFDLKDCYVSAFAILGIYSSIKYKKQWEAFQHAHLPNRKRQRQPLD